MTIQRLEKNNSLPYALFEICLTFERDGFVSEEAFKAALGMMSRPNLYPSMHELSRAVYREFFMETFYSVVDQFNEKQSIIVW